MRRAVIVLALAVVLGACGSDNEPASQGPETAKIESFAHVDVPDSARDVEAVSESSRDESLHASFVIDRADVDAFVRSARLKTPLTKDYKPYAYTEFGWQLDRIGSLLGGEENGSGFLREFVIDLDEPDVATVYLVASEV